MTTEQKYLWNARSLTHDKAANTVHSDMHHGVSLIADQGKGRAYVLVYESGTYEQFARHLFNALLRDARAILIDSSQISESSWREQTSDLIQKVKDAGVRQASFAGFGAACSLVQNITLREAKLVRTAVFVDGAAQPHPTRFSRIVDKIERFLPLGLPLRSSGKAFDGRAFLQRIRCPALVVTTARATPFLQAQAAELLEGMPTCWGVHLQEKNEVEELKRLVEEFQDVPAKCPQKNVARV